MDDAEQFLPMYLRFIRGVLDSNDLPLNVSRELLQQDSEVEAMRSALTKRALDLLARIAKDEPEKYASFWKEFGPVLKEGVGEDPSNRDKILPLLRYASTHEESDEPKVTLADYVGRMKAGQERIYYIIADSVTAARGSPYLEQLRSKGVEVLLLADRVDEWMMGHVREFEGKRFKDVSRGDLELGGLEADADKAAAAEVAKENEKLLQRIKEALGDRISEVKVSTRLTDTPACLVLAEHDLGAQMRKILAATGQAAPESKPALEVNVGHPLLKRLDATMAEDEFAELALVIHDQAKLAESGSVANPGEFVRRLNRLLGQLMAQ
jgi:molecular chaperone HtpG